MRYFYDDKNYARSTFHLHRWHYPSSNTPPKTIPWHPNIIKIHTQGYRRAKQISQRRFMLRAVSGSDFFSPIKSSAIVLPVWPRNLTLTSQEKKIKNYIFNSRPSATSIVEGKKGGPGESPRLRSRGFLRTIRNDASTSDNSRTRWRQAEARKAAAPLPPMLWFVCRLIRGLPQRDVVSTPPETREFCSTTSARRIAQPHFTLAPGKIRTRI